MQASSSDSQPPNLSGNPLLALLRRCALPQSALSLAPRSVVAVYPSLVAPPSGTSCKIVYGSRSISGFFNRDSVTVGDVVVKNQDFIEATRERSLSFVLVKFDGILGLGFQEISVENALPIWDNMVLQNLVNEPVSSFWLNGDPNAKSDGELVFGGVDPKHFVGNHTYVPVTTKGYWQIEMGDFYIGGVSTGVCEGGYAAIVDSGTSLLAGPTNVVTEINHAIRAEGVLSVECKEVIS